MSYQSMEEARLRCNKDGIRVLEGSATGRCG